MSSYVKALYDFTGEPNTSEITITTGEVLSVTRTDVGEGWWEGKNSKGQVGLFPAAYVEVMSAAEVAHINGSGGGGGGSSSAAAAPNQNISSTTPSTIGAIPTSVSTQLPRYDQTTDDWNDGQDDWEDDWDDDNDTYSEIGPASAAISGNQQQNNNIVRQSTFSSSVHQNNYANMNLPPTPSEDNLSMSGAPATVKRSGMFSKSGDSYILGMINIPVSEVEKAYIVQVEQGYSWQPVTQSYVVRVASPKKETKFKGMKSFIAYQLTPSFNNISVSRRYKHFDWLHERLVDKFCLIPIPPLPDKQISGRYEEQFIEHRRVQLQEFVDWMCRHPVLSKCEVWMHFLTCVDAKEWKSGKRAAEKDPLVGISYCSAIFPPEKQLLQSHVDQQMDTCSNFVHSMDSAVKNLLAIAVDQIKRNQIQSRKDFQRIGDGLADLSKALEVDERLVTSNNPLSTSIGRTSGLFISIGQMFGEQPKLDWIPFSDRLHIYRGILGSFPDILSTHKSAMQKRKECERLAADQKMGNAQLVEVGRRTDIISYAVLAEMTHFRSERDEHLKRTMRNFIDAQIQFYQNIIKKLQEAQTQFQ